jgi:hypothetical protein
MRLTEVNEPVTPLVTVRPPTVENAGFGIHPPAPTRANNPLPP